mgnify:FL=1
MKKIALMAVSMALLSSTAMANCPAVTVADSKGVGAGQYPQQYELAEFETLANCSLTMSANSEMAALNGQIMGQW